MISINFIWAVGASIVVSLISFIGIFALMLKEKTLDKILILLVGVSGGALIGSAFFHLIPEALEKSPAVTVFTYITIGFIFFFALEHYLRWRHCHEGHCQIHPFSYLNLVGDGVHNLIDGIIIGASFALDIRLGVVTTTVIILHEIPQEAGDFGVLVYAGMHKHKALFYNFLSAITAVLGSIVGFYFSERAVSFSQFMIPFAAGGFIYVASCDLIPEIHKQSEIKKATLSMAFFIAGIFLMLALKQLY